MKKITALMLCLVLLYLFTACRDNSNADITSDVADNTVPSGYVENTEEIEQTTLPDIVLDSDVTDHGGYEITKGVYITRIDPYSGKYVEDGSNDEVKNVLSVTIINTTADSYQLYDFSIKLPQETYSFSAKSLFAHSQITVLEKNRNTCPKDKTILSSEIENAIVFEEAPTVHLDEIEITFSDSIINVKNLTDKELKNVYVYYKGVKDDIFFGGITYRVSIGDIAPGQLVQNVAERFKPDSMKIVFATFD